MSSCELVPGGSQIPSVFKRLLPEWRRSLLRLSSRDVSAAGHLERLRFAVGNQIAPHACQRPALGAIPFMRFILDRLATLL